MKRWRSGALWENQDFLKMWSGRVISELGSEISGQAIPLTAVLVFGAGPAQLGLLTALGSAPVLLVGLLAGAWVDRVRRRPLLIGADLARTVLLATVPLAAAMGRLSVSQLYMVVILAGALAVLFDVADRSYLPSLVERENLLEGNSKLATTSALAGVAGPALGGGLVQLVGAPIAIAFDALSFVVSGISIALIRRPEAAPENSRAQPGAATRGLAHEIGEGLRLVYRDPVLRTLTAANVTRTFFGSFFAALYLLYLVRELGVSPFLVGVLIGLGSFSSFFGSLFAGAATRRFGPGKALIGSLFVWSSLSFLTPLAPTAGTHGAVPLAIVLLGAGQLLGDWAATIYLINEVSLRQTVTPDRLLGRMNATVNTLVGGVGPLGALVSGWLGTQIGMRPTLFLSAAGCTLSVLWLMTSGWRRQAAAARWAPPDDAEAPV